MTVFIACCWTFSFVEDRHFNVLRISAALQLKTTKRCTAFILPASTSIHLRLQVFFTVDRSSLARMRTQKGPVIKQSCKARHIPLLLAAPSFLFWFPCAEREPRKDWRRGGYHGLPVPGCAFGALFTIHYILSTTLRSRQERFSPLASHFEKHQNSMCQIFLWAPIQKTVLSTPETVPHLLDAWSYLSSYTKCSLWYASSFCYSLSPLLHKGM